MNQHTRPNTRPVYLVDGCRTPFLKARGTPGPFTAADLAVGAGRALLLRQPFPAEAIDEVILGCVVPSPEEMNVARIAALRLGCSERTPAWTVQRNCASGLQALDSAAQSIGSGRADLVLAGGTEAMSQAPVLFGRAFVEWLGRWSRARSLTARGRLLAHLRPHDLTPVIGLLKGLIDPIVGLSMGQTAEHLAWRFGIDRQAMDRFALRSHHRLGTAISDHVFSAEITPLIASDGTAYTQDEGYRADTDLAQLGALRPVFDRPTGAVTAGNSAQVTDGAALLLLASEEAVARWDLTVIAQLVDIQWAALDPTEMGLGPVHAMAPLLHRQGLATGDIDVFEINEAFAAQILACQEAWSDRHYREEVLGDEPDQAIPDDALNPEGGAIAIGHPVGASGARLALHLALSMKRRGLALGVASLCIGGGQGGALLLRAEGGIS